jgi:hypothetical protein
MSSSNEKLFPKHIENNSIIRQLVDNEFFFAVQQKILTNSTVVYSKIDFNNEQELVRQAVSKWREIHPLLSCNVKFNEDRSEAHFVNLHRDYDFQNISFLSLTNQQDQLAEMSDEEERFVFRMLVQREANLPIDVTTDILWRLTFYKYKQSADAKGRFKYSMFLSVHHTISDLKNEFDNLFGKKKNKKTFFFLVLYQIIISF